MVEIRKFIQRGKIKDALLTIDAHFPSLLNEELKIKCSLHSIEFIKLLKRQELEESISYFKQNLEPYQDKNYVVSIDNQGKLVFVQVKVSICYAYKL